MDVKFGIWFFMRANGDGSVEAVHFPSEDLAECYAEDWSAKMGFDRLPHDVYYDVVELNTNEVVVPDYAYNW